MPEAAKLLTDRWTIYYGDRSRPQFHLEVTALQSDQRPAVEEVARQLFGRYGKAEHGYNGMGLPEFQIAVEGPDGTISGARTLQSWAEFKYMRTDGAPVQPQAVLELQAWEDRQSVDARRLGPYGLDADGKHVTRIENEVDRALWNPNKIRRGYGD